MKLLPMLVIASLAIVPLSSMAQAPNTAQLITEGQAAYVKGDYATAKKNFELVNELEPRNVTAINYLRLLAQRSTKVVAGEGIDRQLARVILPKVELKEATLGS